MCFIEAKKDPGIPNNWPFKEEMLNEIEAQRQEVLIDSFFFFFWY
jgi:hypothetical protein